MPIRKTRDPKPAPAPEASAAARLLAWYEAHQRVLPWRGRAGEASDPYRVWLSEIMLQQTTVAAVAPYYRSFLERWPTVTVLAAASQDEVLGAWAGLGYYSRARNLHRAAQVIAGELGGVFPDNAAGLRGLPGIGGYTAAAIAAIAFGERIAAMDANAERVMARLFAFETELPKGRAALAALAEPLVPADRPGDFAQALMDLGSGICTFRNPRCLICPLNTMCQAYRRNIAESLPRKAARPMRPEKRGAAFVALDARDAAYLERRPENGLLGGMLQPPLGPWTEEFPSTAAARRQAPFTAVWEKRPGVVRHVFTHFALELEIYVARVVGRPNGEGRWYTPKEQKTAALPTVMRKVIAHALEAGGT